MHRWAAILCSASLAGCNAVEPVPDASNTTSEVTSVAADSSIIVHIEGFECGDNCYLSYSEVSDVVTEGQSALCNVDACEAWFEEQAMPPEFVGRSATIALGKGKQYDNDGNVMSDDFPAITSITIDSAKR